MRDHPDNSHEAKLLEEYLVPAVVWPDEARNLCSVEGTALLSADGTVLAPDVSVGWREKHQLEEPIACVAGIDEVGRGSLAGPASVGIALVTGGEGQPPSLLTDSKQLTSMQREKMFDDLEKWPAAWAVAHASNEEVVALGLTKALRLAANRGLRQLKQVGFEVRAVLLDGKHDWLAPEIDLFNPHTDEYQLPTQMLIKADVQSQMVAAAASLAKVTRDRFMESLCDPGYDWGSNKGYGSKRHLQGLERLGPSVWHRQGWKGV